MSHKKRYAVYGYLEPRHTRGTYPALVYKWRRVSGRWKRAGYVKAKAYDYSRYTKYKVSFRLSKSGKWRLRAFAPADAGHAKRWSSKYDDVMVK